MGILPASKPIIDRKIIDKIITDNSSKLEKSKVTIVALRGFFSKKNQRGIYDDAFVIVSPTVFAAFNGNCDPSVYRQGIATVKEGVVWFKKGKHGLSRPNPYWALRQSRPIIVIRDDGKGGFKEDKPAWPFTNLHKGGNNGTSSLGCLTVPPVQWDSLRELVYEQLVRYSQAEVPCILTSGGK